MKYNSAAVFVFGFQLKPSCNVENTGKDENEERRNHCHIDAVEFDPISNCALVQRPYN